MVQWTCGSCGFANEGVASHCGNCDLPLAVALRSTVQKEALSAAKSLSWSSSAIAANVWLFFPEVIPAAIVVFGSPLWVLDLLANGQVVAAAVFTLGIAACVYGFLCAARSESQFGAYAAMVGALLVAVFAYSVKT
jgi:hypothetical protein